MSVVRNEMKNRMQRGERVASLNVNRLRSVDIVEVASKAGFEWLFIDLEHGVISEETVGQIAIMSLRTGITPVARVGTSQWHQASRLLDAGCQGIVFPHVETADQARAAVAASKYPPLGSRSLAGLLPQAGYRAVSSSEDMERINTETLTIAMIETKAAVDRINSVASVNGLDALLIGAVDLSADLGIPGNLGDEQMYVSAAAAAAACKRYDLFFGIGGVYDEELLKRYVALGAQFMFGGSDIVLLMEMARYRRARISSCATRQD